MSYSNLVKEEIIKKNIFKKEPVALAQGIFLSAGSIVISGGKFTFALSSENEEVINFLSSTLKQINSNVQTELSKVVKNFKNKERFELKIAEEDNFTLKKLAIVSENKDGEYDISDVADLGFMKSKNSMLAFLTGIFLGSGTLSVPSENKKSNGYHFEMSVSSKRQADLVAEIMSDFDIFPKVIERNSMFVIYLKNCETICDCLNLFGASKTVLDLLNLRVSRDKSSLTNRQINCINANIDKTVNAALRQLNAIEVIQNTIGLENLPDTLNEAALLRVANPEGSLSEVVLSMGNKISKGALAQRFDKLIKLAEELSDDEK